MALPFLPKVRTLSVFLLLEASYWMTVQLEFGFSIGRIFQEPTCILCDEQEYDQTEKHEFHFFLFGYI